MTRKQLYSEVTSLNLQEEIKSRYGKNYTMCSNEALQKVVDEVHKGLKSMAHPARCSEHKGESSFSKLVEILAKKKILLKSEVDAIWKL